MDTDRETFVELAGTDRPAVVRVAAHLDSDVDPLEAYAALTGRTTDAADTDYAYLLESAEKVASSDPDGAFAPSGTDRHARFSFVGYDPQAVVTIDPDSTDVEVFDDHYEGLLSTNGGDTVDRLRSALPDVTLRGFPDRGRQMLDGGFVGFLSYEAVYDLWLDEVGVERPDSTYPDAEFMLTTKTLVFDHGENALSLVFTPIVQADDDAGAIYDDVAAEAERVTSLLAEADPVDTGGFERTHEDAGARESYEEAVERAREAVFDGEIYQGVISRKRELYGDVDALGFYEALRQVNPSPYMYLLAHDDRTIVGASPETLVSVVDGTVVSNPIAGTCPRGSSPVEDRRLAGEMLADGKERAEHTMLVDLARNDVRRVATPGSVRVEEFMNVLKYSHVQHIESTVTGSLGEAYNAFDAVRAAFPAGTLTGAPKIRAMEIIENLEPDPRGPYGGGLGYVSWRGDADFAIVIRTATVESLADGAGPDGVDAAERITVQAGAGIVADSESTAEYEETEKKMDGVLAALDRIETTPVPSDSTVDKSQPADASEPADGATVSDSSGVSR
ncbi:anthranilate synthase component I [Halobacteriales archaeon SW_7_65_23]|nr:MAG: anthranilate synthase component I [Halobacteriales archaeon SW_7_65_23]